MEKNRCSDFRFTGLHTMLHHQYFKMIDLIIEKCTFTIKQLNLNPCTSPCAPMKNNNKEIAEQEEKITEKKEDQLMPKTTFESKENIKRVSLNDGNNNNNRFSALEEEEENDNEFHEVLQEKCDDLECNNNGKKRMKNKKKKKTQKPTMANEINM